jgi:thymidine phosphorylase (EC 2.4.2.4)
MRMTEIILKKRQGQELSGAEINYFVQGYAGGDIPDYQAAALLMAIFFQGLSGTETAELTLAMAGSGRNPELLKVAEKQEKIPAQTAGYVQAVDAKMIGEESP